MGNLHSSHRYDKLDVINSLWKTVGAIPVLPINPHLDALRVLSKHSDGYHDVGNVHSLCKPGKDKDWLEDVVLHRGRGRGLLDVGTKSSKYFLPDTSIGRQSNTISDNGGAVARLLVGPAIAAAWFTKAASIDVRIPECWVREFKKEKWDEMIEHFDPNMENAMLGRLEWHGKRELFVVQKVVLVKHVTVIARYESGAGEHVTSSPVLPPPGVPGVDISARFCSSSTVEFTISATKRNQKLPIAFSGFKYTFDRFGVRRLFGSETRFQPDAAPGASSSSAHATSQEESDSDHYSHSLQQENENEDDFEKEEDEPDIAASHEHMGGFFEDEEDWCTTIISNHDPSHYEIYECIQQSEEEQSEEEDPPLPTAPPAPSAPRNLEEID